MSEARRKASGSRVSAREVRAAVGSRRVRRVPVQVTVPEDLYLRLVKVADAEGVSVGRVILRFALTGLGRSAS